jgi:hypothetical protein
MPSKHGSVPRKRLTLAHTEGFGRRLRFIGAAPLQAHHYIAGAITAIKIGTLNGAIYLGRADHIGTVKPGKDADLLIVRGNPSANIGDIENVEWVVQNGRVYNSAALLNSIKGSYGLY